MSKLAWLVGVFTFLIGLTVNSLFVLQSDLPHIEVDAEYRAPRAVDPAELTGIIELQRSANNTKDQTLQTFKVTNRTHETIYYSGYEKDDNVLAWIRQDGKVEDALELTCWNGVETQRLEPGESATFAIPVPPNKRPFQVGFDFRHDDRDEWTTVWSTSAVLVVGAKDGK